MVAIQQNINFKGFTRKIKEKDPRVRSISNQIKTEKGIKLVVCACRRLYFSVLPVIKASASLGDVWDEV